MEFSLARKILQCRLRNVLIFFICPSFFLAFIFWHFSPIRRFCAVSVRDVANGNGKLLMEIMSRFVKKSIRRKNNSKTTQDKKKCLKNIQRISEGSEDFFRYLLQTGLRCLGCHCHLGTILR